MVRGEYVGGHGEEASSGAHTHNIFAGSADTIEIADAALMFRGDYARSGPDLSITGPDGAHTLIVDYFASAHPATLISPNGAILSGELVSQLAGGAFKGAYAQEGGAAAPAPVGQVEAASGVVTITHPDGTKVTGSVGTPVIEGDIVETSAGGQVSITFMDKTVASLGESARMVVDKFDFEAGGKSNSMLLNIVEGAFVFVAGLVAPTGDMKVQTPVATMGIRGTTGVVRVDVNDGTSYFTLKPDPPGKLGGAGGTVGAFDVFARLNGVLIKEVRQPDQLLVVKNGSGQFDDATSVDPKEAAFQQEILKFAFAAHQQMLERLEKNDNQQQQEQQPGTNDKQGAIPPQDGVHDTGLQTNTNSTPTLGQPLDVDLLLQVDPLNNENTPPGGTTGTGTGTSTSTIFTTTQALPPSFTNAPIEVVFIQQQAEPGINATFPVTFTSTANATITSVIATVVTVAFSVDGAPPLAFSLTPTQIAAFAAAYNPVTGVFDLGIDTTFLNLGQDVIVTFAITIADAIGSDTEIVKFAVAGLNDAPTLAATVIDIADTSAADPSTVISGQLAAHDPDLGATLSYKIQNQTADAYGTTTIVTSYGTLTLSSDGHYTFDTNAASLNALHQDATASVAIAVEVSDGTATTTSTITVNITGENDAPVVVAGGSVGAYTQVGDTTGAGYAYTLVTQGAAGAGAVWQPFDLSQDGHWNIQAYFGSGPTGYFTGPGNTDGIAFAFQNSGARSLGGGGGALGIQGISDAVGFKIDTYPFNTGDQPGGNDFAQFFTGGNLQGNAYPAVLTPLLNDGQFHAVDINWDASSHTLTYIIDGTITASLQRDLIADNFAGSTIVYAGFTAASGAANSSAIVEVDGLVNGTSAFLAERSHTTGSDEMRSLAGTVTFKDAEAGSTHTLSVADPATATFGIFTAKLVTDTNTAIDGKGEVAWTYSVRDGALDVLQAGETATEVYRITLHDGDVTTTTDITITLVVRSEQYAPEMTYSTANVISADDSSLSLAIMGSAGDDIISLGLGNDGVVHSRIDGGGGSNALALLGDYGDVDLTAIAAGRIQNIQEIDLAGSGATSLTLSLDTLIDMSGSASDGLANAVAWYNAAHPSNPIVISTEHALLIEGVGADDSLNIVDAAVNHEQGSWTYAGTLDVASASGAVSAHDVYNFTSTTSGDVMATLAVNHDVAIPTYQNAA